MNTVDEILRQGKARRLDEANRKKIIETFRKNAERSVSAAVMYFVVAIPFGVIVYLDVRSHKEFDFGSVLFGVYQVAMFLFWLGMGLRKLWVSPSDKLLLLLIEEALPEKSPNQALLPTPMAVTDRADARSAPATGAADL